MGKKKNIFLIILIKIFLMKIKELTQNQQRRRMKSLSNLISKQILKLRLNGRIRNRNTGIIMHPQKKKKRMELKAKQDEDNAEDVNESVMEDAGTSKTTRSSDLSQKISIESYDDDEGYRRRFSFESDSDDDMRMHYISNRIKEMQDKAESYRELLYRKRKPKYL